MQLSKRRGNGTTTAALIVVVLLIVVAVFALFSYSNPNQKSTTAKETPAALSLGVPTIQAIGGQSALVDFAIANNGGDASNVVLALQSPSFGAMTLPSISVPAHGQAVDQANIQMKDLANGYYSVSTTLTYDDVNGTHQASSSFSFYLLPNLKITGFSWNSDFFHPLGKSSIGPNDNTGFSVQITSKSGSATYSSLSVSAGFAEVAEGLTITPSNQPAGDIGPQGTSQSYGFTITSVNAVAGSYNITVSILASNFLATQYTFLLKVNSS